MGKNVTVILPHGDLRHVAVADELTSISYPTVTGGSILTMPIEELLLDGKVNYIARHSDLVPEEEVVAAIKSFK